MKIVNAITHAATWGIVGGIAGARLGATVGGLTGAVFADGLQPTRNTSDSIGIALAVVGGATLAPAFAQAGLWVGLVSGAVYGSAQHTEG